MPFRDFTAQLERIGAEEAIIYERSGGTVDEFNNTDWDFDSDPDNDGEVTIALCARTYPNRNTESQGKAGDRKQDSALFIFPLDEWEKVGSDARIGYPEHDGSITLYELKSPTNWPTHVEIFGEEVAN